MTSDASPVPGGNLPTLPVKRVVRPTPSIPDHEVVRQIGSGAYGEVWLAKALTGAWRAVKIVWREDFEDERTFNREFEGILQYEPIARNHPGLVHILHVGRHDEGSPFYYYVMELGDDARTGVHINPDEYIPRTLQTDKKFSGNKPLPLDYCLEVGSQLAHALLYLHSKNLTHRDIKPANVIFVNGRPKLADIGLVAHLDQRSFVGTEGFIPPDGPGTRRADVYALAKVLYEISTGKDRMDFPELPDELPAGTVQKKWQAFNTIICQAAEPRVEECTIDSAEELAEKIDALRGYEVPSRFRLQKKSRRKFRRTFQLLGAAIAGGLTAYWGVLWLNEQQHAQEPDTPAEAHSQQSAPEEESKNGYVLVTSSPAGASVYDADGNYLDETPYGPIELPAGTTVVYTIKKSGFADKEETGTVAGGSTLALGGILKEYHPPTDRQPWKDTEGVTYLPAETRHVAETPLTAALFNKFLKEDKQQGNFQMQRQQVQPGHPEKDLALLTQDGITAYLAWLNKKCEREGLLGKEFSISADPGPQGSGRTDGRNTYILNVTRVFQVPITGTTNLPGASVFFNNRLIGRTPIEEYVNQVPYVIEIKLPGHATMRRRGLDPQDLFLSLQLEPDKSVVFGVSWTNSLGMDLVPVGSNTLAMAHEVRVKDFQQFLKATDRKAPAKPGFPQEEDHPVVNVSRQDARAFAKWLTNRERAQGLIDQHDSYRLPKDAEWSAWMQLGEEKGASPYEKTLPHDHSKEVFPWGTSWPPPNGTGNFADQSALIYLPSSRVIVDYEDGQPYTAPVRSFPPNRLGLYDLEGNVMEWVDDNYGGPENLPIRNHGVARGGSYLSFRPKQLTTGIRTPLPENTRDDTLGFRLVLSSERPLAPSAP